MSGPPKQFDRDEVINKAMQVFWTKGYEATSMQDLVNCMGINRASMYDTFGNKREIFHLAINGYCHNAINNVGQILFREGSPLENLKCYILSMLDAPDNTFKYGCFASNAAVELGPHDVVLANTLREFWQQLENLLNTTLQSAVVSGELTATTNTVAVARLINATLQGLAAMYKAGVPRAQLLSSVEQLILCASQKI